MNVYLREIDDVCRNAQQYLDFDPAIAHLVETILVKLSSNLR
jgi:hypothetical protein